MFVILHFRDQKSKVRKVVSVYWLQCFVCVYVYVCVHSIYRKIGTELTDNAPHIVFGQYPHHIILIQMTSDLVEFLLGQHLFLLYLQQVWACHQQTLLDGLFLSEWNFGDAYVQLKCHLYLFTPLWSISEVVPECSKVIGGLDRCLDMPIISRELLWPIPSIPFCFCSPHTQETDNICILFLQLGLLL